ncbi:MAG TPA: flagellar hook-basal body complex protein [Chloroflexota bacterium]|nr:flagellar hook-basal body complex protein [Chloroflexota bacterium]
MFDGVSGLQNHQTWMNVIGNNIANVNTSGYKDGLFNFMDQLSETIRGASAGTPGGPGGTDFVQTGLGTQNGSITSNQQQGSLQTTNLPTDFAIQGDGFFIVSDGVASHYTRDSNFIVDGFGNINQASTGFHLQGHGLRQVGNVVSIDTSRVVNLSVPQQTNPAQETNVLDLFGNLQSSTTTPQTQSVGVFDSLGQLHNVVLTFTPPTTVGGDWLVSAVSNDLSQGARIDITGGNDQVNNVPGAGTSGGQAALHFNALGQLDGTVTPLMLIFNDGTATAGPPTIKPPEPWVIPNTTTNTNAIQAAVQLNLNDNAVGAVTAFASPTALQTQAVPNTAPLLGTQNKSADQISGNLTSAASVVVNTATTVTFTGTDTNGFVHTFELGLLSNAGGTTWTPNTIHVDGAVNANVSVSTTGMLWTGGVTTATESVFISAAAFSSATIGYDVNDVNAQQTFTIDFSKVTNTALNAGLIPENTGSAGNSAGSLKAFNVDKAGVIHGVYTNGFTQTIGQILLATFENPGGLQKEGLNNLQVSANSGVVNVGTPGSGRFGTVAEGNIETSNVDLAFEFSNMILAERGFQANSRIITTSDQMLQEVVDLKR